MKIPILSFYTYSKPGEFLKKKKKKNDSFDDIN